MKAMKLKLRTFREYPILLPGGQLDGAFQLAVDDGPCAARPRDVIKRNFGVAGKQTGVFANRDA